MQLDAFNKAKDTIKNIKHGVSSTRCVIVRAASCLLGFGCSGGRRLLRSGEGKKAAVVVVEVEVGNGGDDVLNEWR